MCGLGKGCREVYISGLGESCREACASFASPRALVVVAAAPRPTGDAATRLAALVADWVSLASLVNNPTDPSRLDVVEPSAAPLGGGAEPS